MVCILRTKKVCKGILNYVKGTFHGIVILRLICILWDKVFLLINISINIREKRYIYKTTKVGKKKSLVLNFIGSTKSQC